MMIICQRERDSKTVKVREIIYLMAENMLFR